jgi:hypothetical protein
LDRNADVVQSFDKQFVAPSATSTKTKFANRGWFGKMEGSSANNLLKQETGRSHDLQSYRNSALAARARYMIRKPSRWYTDFETEGAVVAKYIQNTYPNAKIGILYQNDDFGKDYVRGLRAGLGTKASQIVAEAPMNFPIRQSTRKVLRTQISALRRRMGGRQRPFPAKTDRGVCLNDVHHPSRNNAMNRHGQSDRQLVRLRRLATEDRCHLPPRADLMPRRFSCMAMDASVSAPVARMAWTTGIRPDAPNWPTRGR